MFTPLTLVRNKTRGSWSVCLYHKESKKRYWIDIGLDERWHEFEIDWNQYIFYNSDHDDMERKAFQEDCDNADEAFSDAVQVLVDQDEVFLGEDGDYYIKGDWKQPETINI